MLQRSLFLIISSFLFFANPVFSAEISSINGAQIGVPHLQFESNLGSVTGNKAYSSNQVVISNNLPSLIINTNPV